MNTAFHQIDRLRENAKHPPIPRDRDTQTATVRVRNRYCTECETELAEIRVTAVCSECRDQARREKNHNTLITVLLMIAALGVVFLIGFNVGLGRGPL